MTCLMHSKNIYSYSYLSERPPTCCYSNFYPHFIMDTKRKSRQPSFLSSGEGARKLFHYLWTISLRWSLSASANHLTGPFSESKRRVLFILYYFTCLDALLLRVNSVGSFLFLFFFFCVCFVFAFLCVLLVLEKMRPFWNEFSRFRFFFCLSVSLGIRLESFYFCKSIWKLLWNLG